jgi:hypothetical protein
MSSEKTFIKTKLELTRAIFVARDYTTIPPHFYKAYNQFTAACFGSFRRGETLSTVKQLLEVIGLKVIKRIIEPYSISKRTVLPITAGTEVSQFTALRNVPAEYIFLIKPDLYKAYASTVAYLRENDIKGITTLGIGDDIFRSEVLGIFTGLAYFSLPFFVQHSDTPNSYVVCVSWIPDLTSSSSRSYYALFKHFVDHARDFKNTLDYYAQNKNIIDSYVPKTTLSRWHL